MIPISLLRVPREGVVVDAEPVGKGRSAKGGEGGFGVAIGEVVLGGCLEGFALDTHDQEFSGFHHAEFSGERLGFRQISVGPDT